MSRQHNPYERYQPTDIDWLDQIPKQWEVWKISHLLQLKSGESLSAEEFGASGLYPVFGGNGLRGHFKNYNLEGDYILIGRQGALCGNINYGSGKFWVTEHALVVYPQRKIANKWLGEMLRAMDLNQYSVSAAQPGLSVPNITSLRIPLPPLEEQTQIAKFLDYETARIDALIEKQQQLIALLKEKRQAVISHAVTKGLNPNAPMRDSGIEWLGEVPAHWEVRRLYHLSSRIGDGLHGTPVYQDGTGLYFVNGNNLDNGEIVLGQSAKEVSHREFARHFIPMTSSTVLLSINGTIGNVAIYANEKVILGKSAAYIHCNEELLPDFLQFFFQSHNSNRYYQLVSTGTTISNLSLDSIRRLKIGLPGLEEQELIVEFCSAQSQKYDDLIEVASDIADKLRERRTALISAAVTGKIDVRNWQPPKPEPTKQPEAV